MTRQGGLRKPRVLFICTGNTARSQVAQVLLEQRAPDRVEVVSAGLEPGEVNPLTVRALQESGLSVDHLHSEGSRHDSEIPVRSVVRKVSGGLDAE